MYNRNPIGSGAPDFAAMFAPPVYTPPKDATENNLSSIAALQDPTGTLQRMQAEKVIGAMADLKTDGIDNIYRQRALDAINGFQQFATGLYGKNTGLNRLTLDGQQQLEQTQKARETLTDLNALRGLSADYRKTIDEAAQDFKSGTITREDYNRFVTELDGLTSGAKSIGDLPMAHAVYNMFLMNKPYDWAMMSKDLKTAMDGAKTTKSVKKEGADRFNVETLDPTPVVNSLFDYNQRYRDFWMQQTGGDPIKARNLALEYGQKYGVNNETWGGTVRSATVNNYGPDYKKPPKFRITEDKELQFNVKPTEGVIITDRYVNSNSASSKKPYIEPGDLFVPKKTIIKDGQRYVTGVTVNKADVRKITPDGGVEFSSGAVLTPVTVPVDANMKGLLESNYFRSDMDGVPDRRPWDMLGGTAAPAPRPKNFVKELDVNSDITPASLVKDGVYLVGGEYRVWDGSKLRKAQ